MNYSKFSFYLSYIYFKLRIPLDVKVGWKSVFLAEILWISNNLLKTKFTLPEKFKMNYFETIFGKFYITPDVISMVTVSPAFERLDTDYLETLLGNELNKGKKVLFIDIGAYFGDYVVRIGNKYKNNKNLKIVCFEPGTEYLSLSTLDQLKKNIKINNIKNIDIFDFGIGSRTETNKIGVKTKPLDKVLGTKYSKYDLIFIKLDIDDFVIDGLTGILKTVSQFNETYLLVEDFVKPKQVFGFLRKNNFQFLIKKTSYNSFWYVKKNKNS